MKNLDKNPSGPALLVSRVGIVVCSILLTLASATPCLAQASKKAEKAADSLKDLAKEVQEGEAQLGVVTASLDQLVNKENADLRKPYKAFQKAVEKLTDIAGDAKKRREGLNKNKDAYFKAWDEEIATIQNEDIRSRSAERRQKVQQQLESLSTITSSTADNYRALEQNLKDIQTALSVDLTPGGIKTIAPVANKANQSAAAVRENLTKLHGELETLGFALSAKAPQKK